MIDVCVPNAGKWTWNDLHKKLVQVIYFEGNSETMEPPCLSFFCIDEGLMYHIKDLDKTK